MPRQNRNTAEDAKMRYSAAYPTGAERMFSWSYELELENG